MSKFKERRRTAEALTLGQPKAQYGVAKRVNKTVYLPDVNGKPTPKIVEKRTMSLTPNCTRRVYKNLKRLDDGQYNALVAWLRGDTALG